MLKKKITQIKHKLKIPLKMKMKTIPIRKSNSEKQIRLKKMKRHRSIKKNSTAPTLLDKKLAGRVRLFLEMNLG